MININNYTPLLPWPSPLAVATNPADAERAAQKLTPVPEETPDITARPVDLASRLNDSFEQVLNTVREAETPDPDKKQEVLSYLEDVQTRLNELLGSRSRNVWA